MTKPKFRIGDRLKEARLSEQRFVDVRDGEKASIDHTKREPEAVSGNYGIYATATDTLVILDLDDYDGEAHVTPLSKLPPTLEQTTPHGGTHRLYAVQPTDDGRLPAAVLADEFGTANPAPSWGEVRVDNQYVVGAGSELDGCDKDWCDSCSEPDGGQYAIANDREIAAIDAETLVDVLEDDPDLAKRADDGGSEKAVDTDVPAPEADESELLEYARECDEKLDRLWRGDYSDYDGDRSKAESALAMKLAFWFQGDKQTVRRLMDRSNAKKWHEREDASYRESVLRAVDKQTDYYDPSEHGYDDPSDFDPDEVERGEAILRAQTSQSSPAGDLEHKNGCYGIPWVYRDDEGNITDSGFDTVCNFTIETLSYLDTQDGELMHLRIHPQSPLGDAYEVRVLPTAFNSAQSFKEEVVRGRTTTFDPSNREGVPRQTILNNLRETAGRQSAPQHRATPYIGLHGDGVGYDEWVTPDGVLTADGWAETPTYKHHDIGGDQDMDSSLADKWQLSAEDDEYDEDIVRSILERVPWTRQPERGLPILGWFYAAPLKPYLHDWEGEYNLLQVTGESGAGKTSILEMYYELFGADPAPFGCGDTGFTIERKLGGSCGLPIWLDEYKPSDLPEGKMNWLHRRLRQVTREKTVAKGRASLDEIHFRLRAPTVFSGEQTVQEAAVRRRSVMTHLTGASTDGDYEQAYCELSGASYTDGDGEPHYPTGKDLSQHALAYYCYILGCEHDDLREWWEEARETTTDLLRRLGVDELGDTEQRGLQTIAFGLRVYREFAVEHGVSEAAMPGETELRNAFSHVVENIGPEGRRREHIDEFVELLSGAAADGYLEDGVHHRIVDSRAYESEVLAIHMPTAFAAVKKYVREFNLEDDYTLLGKGDYLDSLRDKAENGESYPLAVNKRVRGLENGSKAVYIDPETAREVIGPDFNIDAFVDREDEDEKETASDEDGDGGGTQIAGLEPGHRDFEATVAAKVVPKPWLQGEGTLSDSSEKIDYVVRGDQNPLAGVDEGDAVQLQGARVETDEDGVLRVEVRAGVTTVTPVDASGQQVGLDTASESSDEAEASTDGGEEYEQVQPDVMQFYREADSATVAEAAGALDADPKEVEHAVERLAQQGDLYDTGDGYRAT